MTNFNNPNSSGDIPPNPFATPSDLPAIPSIPGFDVAAGKSSPISLHGILVGVIVVIAAGALWGMRHIGLSGAKPTEGATINLDAGSISASTVDHRPILSDLNATRTENQVRTNELRKNPFELSTAAKPKPVATPEKPVPTEDDPTGEKTKAAARLAEIKTELGKLKLNSVMGGATPVARIDGQVYRLGDVVNQMFTIIDVEGRNVTLMADNKQYILSMDP